MLKQHIKLTTFSKTAKINFEERTQKFLYRIEVNNVNNESCTCAALGCSRYRFARAVQFFVWFYLVLIYDFYTILEVLTSAVRFRVVC